MKKSLLKRADILAAFALIVANISANSLCLYHFGQPKAPDSLKKLRKF